MGFLDAILGRSKPPPADLNALFAVPQAAVSLQVQGFVPTGTGSVCYRAGEGMAFAQVETQAQELVKVDGSQVTTTDDSFGFRWLTVAQPSTDSVAASPSPGVSGPDLSAPAVPGPNASGPDVSGLVTHLHAVNSSLRDSGFDQSLLCSTVVFAAPSGQKFALVYLYKRGTFYPFAPIQQDRRDNALELQVRGIVETDLTIEPDLSRWLAIWGAPGM